MYRKSTVVSLLFLITLLALAAPLSIQAAPPGSTLADVQVNQDLVGLQQAETSVAMNPLDPRNVVVTYTATGLGYQTRLGGPVPTITVSLQNINFQFFFLGGLLGFADITVPSMLSTVTGEDGQGHFFLTVGFDLLSGRRRSTCSGATTAAGRSLRL